MARYKIIRPEDHQLTLAKKRMKIRKTVDGIYVCLMVLIIAICGIQQTNSILVGIGLVLLGAFSAVAIVFHLYADRHGWGPVFWYDEPEHRKYISPEAREKDVAEIQLLQKIKLFCFGGFAVACPVLGILKLFEVI